MKDVRKAQGLSSFGYAKIYKKDPFAGNRILFEKFGKNHGVANSFFGPWRVVQISDPEIARRILIEKEDRYCIGKKYQMFGEAVGRESMFATEGQTFRTLRATSAPAFKRESLLGWIPEILAATRPTLKQWSGKIGGQIELVEDMEKLAQRIFLRIFFGVDLEVLPDNLRHRLHEGLEYVVEERVKAMFPRLGFLRRYLPGSRFQKYQAFMREAPSIFGPILSEGLRRAAHPEEKRRTTILDMFLEAAKNKLPGLQETPPGSPYPPWIFDQVMTLIGASFETTGTTLTYILDEIYRNREIRERLLSETQPFFDTDGGLDSLQTSLWNPATLPFTKAVVAESMRRDSATVSIWREAKTDDEINGWRIPKGSFLDIFVWGLHNHPAYWADVTAFRPERFLDDEGRFTENAVTPGTYLPWSLGHRRCVGENLAKEVLWTVTPLLVRQATLYRDGQGVMPAEMKITVRPVPGTSRMTITRAQEGGQNVLTN